MEFYNCIMSRKSIRKYIPNKDIKNTVISQILQTANYTPSYKNLQPWKIHVVKNKEKINEICKNSIYYEWMKNASVLLVIFLDGNKSFDRLKDLQSIGALIQNILLTSNNLGLGSCWIGEILNKKDNIKKLLCVEKQYELMAIITIGYKDLTVNPHVRKRKNINEFILDWDA